LPSAKPNAIASSLVSNVSSNVGRSYWIPGSYAPLLSKKQYSFLRLLKNKGFKAESMTKVGLNAIGTSTTLESNKSHFCLIAPLWEETISRLQTGPSPADGDRVSATTYVLASDATTYRLLTQSMTKSVQSAGVLSLYGKTAHTFDASHTVPVTDEVWFDTDDTHRAITRYAYDMQTGNLLQRWKPVQNAANTTSTTFSYDARKLFATTAVNELGHTFNYIYDYGTGTQLATYGPNVRQCVTNTTTCVLDATHPLQEQHNIVVDGLGRTIAKWDTVSDDGDYYTLYQREATLYIDSPGGTLHNAVLHRTRLDIATNSVWKQEQTELDGHGRPIRVTLSTQGSAPHDQITTFHYRNDGTLHDVTVPDPTKNDASTVMFTYSFDSLGQATAIRRPDATTPAHQSGADIAYDGLTQTTSEVVGAGGGQSAVTRTTHDAFGRLTQVDEQTAAAPATRATTHYRYDPDDQVTTVIDPEGVTTTLSHDFAGHRTQIARAGWLWKYTYDTNGNLIAAQAPGSSNPPVTDPLYTTTTAYDDLDRPVSKTIAPRALSSADQTLFGVGTETYTWDIGGNHIGSLRYWRADAPGATTPTVALNVANNNQGQRTNTVETLTIAGYPTLKRSFTQHYYLFGGVRIAAYRDAVGGSNETTSVTSYDARGLPSRMHLHRPGTPTQTVAVQTRNVAGLVTKRRTDIAGTAAPMAFIESNWTYDTLGRVTSQVVQQGPGPTQVVRQDLAYFGNDDPKLLDHYLGTSKKTFQYAYDLRHQLTNATETTTPGYFSATYNYGPAGRFKHAQETILGTPPTGSDVTLRDVNYQYAGTDPEQVTGLKNVSNGATFASYSYDLAGNQTSRTYANGDRWDYLYDGKDQLRRVTKKNAANVVQGIEEFWYDGNGQRIAIVKRDSAGNKTELIWFIRDTEAHYEGIGTVLHVYSHLSLGTPVARVDRTADTMTSLEFQFHGLANNTLAAVDQAGTINASFVYSPAGELIEVTDAGAATGVGVSAHRRRMNDKFHDESSALAYYGARYYDQISISWTQGDPLYRFAPDMARKEPRRASLYVSDLNNPLRYIDPDGRDGATIKDADFYAAADATLKQRQLMEASERDKWKIAECQRTKGKAQGCGIGSRDRPKDPKTKPAPSTGNGSPAPKPDPKPKEEEEEGFLSRVGSGIVSVAHAAKKAYVIGCIIAPEVCVEFESAVISDALDFLGVGSSGKRGGSPGGGRGFQRPAVYEPCGGKPCIEGAGPDEVPIKRGVYKQPFNPGGPGLCPQCAEKEYEELFGRRPTSDDVKLPFP
jgi:RHS repeat-associated protein